MLDLEEFVMRLFIAINFGAETRSRLIALREQLRSRSRAGNFSFDENLHLTLAFIGECSPKDTGKIKSELETVALTPFEVRVERLGTFSHGTLWWAGLSEDEPLMALQREIARRLTLLGFPSNDRKYSPHITLGREVVTDARPWPIIPFGETAGAIDLMKSERLKGRLTYTSIFKKSAGA